MNPQDSIRKRFFPHLWCVGCGHGTVLNALLRSVDELGLAKGNIVMVTGIGCSARMAGYVDFHTMHTLHGRALAFATGIKMSRPELNILVPMGDGDALAIGGNHFLHAARRNIDMTAIVMNNRNYGMTGGQFSPLSGEALFASTAPWGNIDPAFDVMELSKAAGATHAARTTTFHVRELQKRLTAAISHRGFSVVEVLSQCPTYHGRKNNLGGAPEMLKRFRDGTAKLSSRALKENPELIPRGVFVDRRAPEYGEAYAALCKRAAEAKPPRAQYGKEAPRC